MSYKYSFADNKIYGAEDLNAITKRLVTSGIEDSFTDGVAYNVSKFNEAGKLLYTSGVVPESCLTLKVIASGEGKILINPGMAFFDDGSVIEIEDGGEEMAYTPGVYNYVYLKNDLINTNSSYPCCGADAPVGDFVLLAEIDKNSNIIDRRTYAKGKLPGYQSVGGQVLYFNEAVELTLTGKHYAEGDATFDIGANNFEYIIGLGFSESGSQYETLAAYRISDGTIVSFNRTGDSDADFSSVEMELYFNSNGRRTMIKPSLTDGVLNIHAEVFAPSDSLGVAGDKMKVAIGLIFI